MLRILAVACAVAATAAAAAKKKPNVVILFADDFGWGDLPSYGHPTQERGAIDTMADEGLRFTQWYSGDSLCTPSRAALMTGRLPIRNGMIPAGTKANRVGGPTDSGGLPDSELTLAEAMKAQGYVTGQVGKWHLGINRANNTDGHYLPLNRGFDFSGLTIPFSNHWACDEKQIHMAAPNPAVCFLYRGQKLVQQPIDHRNLSMSFARDGVGFIDTHANDAKPFFLYYAFAHMHVNMFNNEEYDGSSVNGVWGQGMNEMNWEVGQVLDALRAHSIEKDTLVFFTSDHGPHIELCLEGGNAAGLRGGKAYSSWEGGMRVPGIAWWPGTIAPGSTTSALASTMDMFVTALELAGGSLPTDRTYDGRSLVTVLKSATPATAATPHDFYFYYCSSRLMAVRHGVYKVRFFSEELPHDDYPQTNCAAGGPTGSSVGQSGSPHGEFFQTWGCYGKGIFFHDPPQIFDIESDKSELYNLNSVNTTANPKYTALLSTVLSAVAKHNATLEGAAGVGSRQPTQLGTGVKTNQPWGCGAPPDGPPGRTPAGPALGSCEGAPGDAGWEVRNHTGGGGPGYAHFPGFSLSIDSVNECRAKCCADAHCVSITLGPTAAAAAKEEDVVEEEGSSGGGGEKNSQGYSCWLNPPGGDEPHARDAALMAFVKRGNHSSSSAATTATTLAGAAPEAVDEAAGATCEFNYPNRDPQ